MGAGIPWPRRHALAAALRPIKRLLELSWSAVTGFAAARLLSVLGQEAEVSRAGALTAQGVIGVHQLAQVEREAAAPDASGELVTQLPEAVDALIEIAAPRGGKPLPVAARWRAAV